MTNPITTIKTITPLKSIKRFVRKHKVYSACLALIAYCYAYDYSPVKLGTVVGEAFNLIGTYGVYVVAGWWGWRIYKRRTAGH